MSLPRVDASRSNGQSSPSTILHAACGSTDTAEIVGAFEDAFGECALAFIVIFASARCDKPALAKALTAAFGDTPIIGCTTAGEIDGMGYKEGSVVGIGFPASHFAIRTHLLEKLSTFSIADGAQLASTLLTPDGFGETALWPNSFVLLLVDGCSRQEDALVSSVAPSLGATPLVGGSAGDGLDFQKTFILEGGRFHEDAAVLSLIRTRCDVDVVRFDHFSPTTRKMIVTSADPEKRIVHEINAEPAAREYARMVGKDPGQLSPFIFAENPVVVRVGGEHHVRAIQKVEDNGDLRFYCAIDEGLVLTVAEAGNIVENIDAALGTLNATRTPDMILGFDCVLRRLEVEQKQQTKMMSDVLRAHRVFGFNTYGEQFGNKHVNQTFTGICFYPPAADGTSAE